MELKLAPSYPGFKLRLLFSLGGEPDRRTREDARRLLGADEYMELRELGRKWVRAQRGHRAPPELYVAGDGAFPPEPTEGMAECFGRGPGYRHKRKLFRELEPAARSLYGGLEKVFGERLRTVWEEYGRPGGAGALERAESFCRSAYPKLTAFAIPWSNGGGSANLNPADDEAYVAFRIDVKSEEFDAARTLNVVAHEYMHLLMEHHRGDLQRVFGRELVRRGHGRRGIRWRAAEEGIIRSLLSPYGSYARSRGPKAAEQQRELALRGGRRHDRVDRFAAMLAGTTGSYRALDQKYIEEAERIMQRAGL